MDYVAASVNEILCEMTALEKISRKQAEDFEHRFHELKAIAVKFGKYWGGRWALNCTIHTLQTRIKARNKDGSWSALNKLLNIYYDWDISTGWDAGARQTMSQLEGIVYMLSPYTNSDFDRGIGLLARAFMSRLGYLQRPEGIRDVGFCLARGLRKKGGEDMKRTANILERLMHQTVDSTSVIWPWRSERKE